MTIQDIYQIFLSSEGICTDTRKASSGTLFFALSGANFNGNQFAEQALEKGCLYAVIDDYSYAKDDRFILVDDCLKTLQNLATHHRKTMKHCKFIAVTGSNGKTTSKELMAKVLSSTFKTVYTYGNLNNHIGVPLTLLSIKEEPDFAIIEMGANHQGEIKELMEIALPDYGYITNFGLAHLEGMGGIEGVVKTKSELYDYLRSNNCFAFVNTTDSRMKEKSEGIERLLFGNDENSYANIELLEANPFLKIKLDIEGKSYELQTNMIGEYNINNMLAAACIGSYFKVPVENICKAISNYSPDNNRSQFEKTNQNELIMDAYNANPSSMKVALMSFDKMPSAYPKVAILGMMMELGIDSIQLHEEILELALSLNLEQIIVVVKDYPVIDNFKLQRFEEISALKEFLVQNKLIHKSILVKGSRSNQLEQIKDLL